MQLKIPSGSSMMDLLLEGGYDSDTVTTIYGKAGSGKTNLCICAAIACVLRGKQAVYIDTEGGFSIERLKQLTPVYEEVLKNTLFLKPTTFAEQKKCFSALKEHINKNIGIIIIDSIAMLYRLEIGRSEDVYDVNRELGRQISYLTSVARKHGIPVLLSNQVYSNFDERDKVNMVGGDVLKYGSKCLIELQALPLGKRKAILHKHRSLPPLRTVMFEIRSDAVAELESDL